MDAITYSAARQNLAQTMNAVCENHAPVIITRQKSEPVVLMSLADFNSIQETAYLLGNPANAAHLRESLAQVERGEVVSCSLDEL
ncbi:type II toxin-antitoxin system Phd/YefM family antitoxin [uncultured Desulfovibrio sp.]|uniref:type II toxin-antitoxin system Phd/YefM family antitoxin n=1 Tax=uncultured Desulfovibrio sp. TaxID=167968 RepID=UPI0025FC814A|nr:type II toxin-antitoxin system prevent-host-death family antitoxin [uncultured Desulfovibrio sp.]